MAQAATYPNRYSESSKEAVNVGASGAGFNMRERKEPEMIRFNEGDVFTGILVSIERVEVRDRDTGRSKPCTRYLAEDMESGEPKAFLGSYQLDSKLRVSDIGHVVEIRSEGVDPNIGRNGNGMKRYKVLVSDVPAPGWAMNGTRITDDDFPEQLR